MFQSDDNGAFDALRATQQSRHGLAMAYIQEQVGPGTEYANEVARAVLSDAGGYCHLTEMPEEFSGALGAGVSHRLVSQTEAHKTLLHLRQWTEAIASGASPLHTLSLCVLYAGGSLRQRRELLICDHKPSQEPFLHGTWQPNALPRFFKARIETKDDPLLLAHLGLPASGVVFFVAPSNTDDGRCLLATITRTESAIELSRAAASSPTIN